MHSFIAISDSETKYLKLKPLGFQKDNFKKKIIFMSFLNFYYSKFIFVT